MPLARPSGNECCIITRKLELSPTHTCQEEVEGREETSEELYSDGGDD